MRAEPPPVYSNIFSPRTTKIRTHALCFSILLHSTAETNQESKEKSVGCGGAAVLGGWGVPARPRAGERRVREAREVRGWGEWRNRFERGSIGTPKSNPIRIFRI